MYVVCNWVQILECGQRLAKKKYLRLTIEKIHKIAVFTNKYLRLCSSTRTYFTAANPKTEMQSKITEIQII